MNMPSSSARLRALFVAPNLNMGGAERQWASLIERLPKYDVEPEVLTLDGRGYFFDALRSKGINAHCAEWKSGFDILRIGRVANRLGLHPDIIVARGFSAHVAAWRLSHVFGTPYAVTEHTQYELLPPNPRRAAMLRVLAPRAPSVIAISETQRLGLVKYGFRSERITVIPNGVTRPEPSESARSASLKAKYGLRDDGTCSIALVAALRPEKRIGDFVEAINRVRALGINVQAVVAGGGDQLERYRQRAKESGGNVNFLGQVENVDELWSIVDVACLTSEHEVMSMTLLEAMAHGLPLVATNVGATADLCIGGANGFLVDVGDIDAIVGSLVKLATDSKLRLSMGERSSLLVRSKFDVDAMSQQYAQNFRTLVDQ